MAAIVNTYSKGVPKEEKSSESINFSGTITLEDYLTVRQLGEAVSNINEARVDRTTFRPNTSFTIPNVRQNRRIRRTGQPIARTENNGLEIIPSPTSDIELDLRGRSGSIELTVQPDAPNQWAISEDPFGPR